LGLSKILVFSILSGLSLAFTIRLGGNASDAGFSFFLLNVLSQNVDSRIQILLMIISLVVTIFFVYGLVRFFKEILENRLAGMVTSILGFSGSLLVMTSPQDNMHFIILGLGTWVIGAVIAFFGKKKVKHN